MRFRLFSGLLILMLGSAVTGAQMDDHGFVIGEVADGQGSISYFDYREATLDYFHSRGLQGGGYTWEALAEVALRKTFPSLLSDIEFSSEGDVFFAFVTSKAAQDELKKVLERLASDLEFREECIRLAEKAGALE